MPEQSLDRPDERATGRPARGVRRVPRRRRLLTGVIAMLLTALAACSGDLDSPLPNRQDTEGATAAARRLATALSERDLSGLTFADRVSGSKKFDALTDPLGDAADLTATAAGEPSVDGDRATDEITLRWKVPGAGKPWSYTVTAEFAEVEDSWRPVWSPTLVHPRLTGGGRLEYQRDPAERGRILGHDGEPLVKNRPVVRIGIDKTRVPAEQAARSARRLARLLGIDVDDYVEQVEQSGSKAYVEAIVYRRSDPNRPSDSDLSAIDGALAIDDQAMLAPSRTFAAPILGVVGDATREVIEESEGEVAVGDQVGLTGLQARYDEQLRGRPEITISVVPPERGTASPAPSPSAPTPTSQATPSAEPTQVFHSTAEPGSDLEVSLDRRLQTVAEDILSDIDSASALVAIKPSTGQVLAAANSPGTEGRNIATYGQFPPGSTFKIIDALALIRNGTKPSDPMNCPPTITVDGRTFENYDDYPASRLGSITFAAAFANSCNTAFIDAHDQVSTEELNAAAASLGMGTDYDVGYPAYFGSIPKPESTTERAATMIGQGRVLASPLTMATVVASIRAGETVLPELVQGEGAEPKAKPLTEREAQQLRALMNSVVTDGSGSLLQPLAPPEVIAKTGTAEYGTEVPPKTHAWMVAGQGDLAVAVFVGDGKSGSGDAGPLLREFLERA